MLVLGRKLGEKIYIGDDIVIHVLESGNHQVRIGVQAPQDVQVHREEVYKKIQRNREIVV